MAKKVTKQVGGRTIAAWKEQLRQKYPEAFKSDPSSAAQAERIKAMADDVNQWAQAGGYDFTADSQQVIKWIEQDRKAHKPGRKPRQQTAPVPATGSNPLEAAQAVKALVDKYAAEQVKGLADLFGK